MVLLQLLMKIGIFLGVLSVLIVVHEFGHFIVAKRVGVRVDKFSIGFGPRLFTRKKGETEYSLSAIPLGGYVKLAGDSLEEYSGDRDEYYTQPPGKRFAIIFCGPLLNYILGFLCFWMIFFMGYPTYSTKVGGLMDGFGAKSAGVEVQDVIVKVNGTAVSAWEEIRDIVQGPETPAVIPLLVRRGEREIEIPVRIKEESKDDLIGGKTKVGLLGITPDLDDTVYQRYGVGRALSLGFRETVDLTSLTYRGLWRMLTGRLSMKESVTGPLGIYKITAEAADQGMIALMFLVAVLNISLAIFNLLPLPILDGGHVLFLGIEKIRGRPLSVKTERVIMQVGLYFIVMLALLVTYNDILRIVTGQ